MFRDTSTLALFLLSLLTSGLTQALVVKIQSSDGGNSSSQIVKRVGESVTLNCTVVSSAGSYQNIFHWEKTDAQIGHALTNSTTPMWSTVVIRKITVKDGGRYKCSVTNGKERGHSVINIVVNSPPRLLTGEDYSTPSRESLLTEEETVFHCFATGSPTPTVKWFKDGIELHNLGLGKTVLLKKRRNGLDLKIPLVRMQHAGIYTCWAGNKLGNTSRNLRVLVTQRIRNRKPRMQAVMSPIVVPIGWSPVLRCKGQNIPEFHSMARWTKNFTNLPDTAKYKENFTYYDQEDPNIKRKLNLTLKISNVTKQDSGVYSCEVSSQKGNAQDDIYLKVLREDELPKPSVSIQQDNANMTVTEGSNVKITCLVTHPRTYLTSTWWTAGNTSAGTGARLEASPRYAQKTMLAYTNKTTLMHRINLMITNVSSTDQGWYTCRTVLFLIHVTRKVYLTVRTALKPNVDGIVSGKIQSLRITYWEELWKVKQSRGTGKGAGEIYTPKWRCYDKCSFLKEIVSNNKPSFSNINDVESSGTPTGSTFPGPMTPTPTEEAMKKKQQGQSWMDTAASPLSELAKGAAVQEDGWDVFGRDVANSIRAIDSKKSQRRVKFAVQTAIFQASTSQIETN